MKLINVCLDCNEEWEQNYAILCPYCGSADFYTITDYDYRDINIEDVLDMQEKGFFMVCDADKHEIVFDTEV